jgi:hypothetical protein
MKISIALASYNGSKFIGAQLDSFAAQSLRPDEVVICDDGSADDTEGVVRGFAETAPFPVHFHANPERLGYTRNFERAISLCTGDIIFLSDQDDVWFEDKLAAVSARFEAEPGIQVVVNDQLMTDGDLRPGGASKLENLRRLGQSSDGLIEGCCTAITAQWARAALPIPRECQELLDKVLSYDMWLNQLAIFLGTRRMVERPLQYFRRHGANSTSWMASEPRAVGVADLVRTREHSVPAAGWQRRIDILDIYADWLLANRLAVESAGIGDVEAALGAIAHERESHAARIALTKAPLVRRLPLIARLLGRGGYRYFYGWKSAARDIVRSA